MADWAQFVRAGGMGADAMKPGQRPARELIDYHNRMAHAHEHGASIPAYSGIHYSLAEVSLDRPRDAKALSVYVPGARQTYGLGYEETLAAAAVQTATGNTPAALEWPVPFGSRDRAVEGYTGHVPLADSMLGLTTAERVRLSERRLAEGHLFHPHRDVRHEPAAQPHAGFPYAAEQVEGLAAQRQRLVDTRQQSAKQRAETLRHAVAVLSSRPGSAAAGRPSGPRVHSREVSRLVFDEGERGEQLGPRELPACSGAPAGRLARCARACDPGAGSGHARTAGVGLGAHADGG
ncbi:hypothetical protein KFE25_009307 [Diacronema lutheri]|uniref:Uncharacterized protein n=1 Tax=Diacronema lutheri TaxID=2081491 RepID=A0A8J6CH81_DIALT|nr:hypothetical protein KFE25_009307 [Diacronema lutheri]